MALGNQVSEHGLGQNTVKPTPGKTPAPKRTVLPAPPVKAAPRRVSLNPIQQATLNVNRMLAPQYSAADQEAARQNQAIRAYTTAVMQQLAGEAPQIQGDYNNAIGAQQGMADAAAQSLRNVNPSGDVAALLNAVGAPQAQNTQIQGNLNNAFNGGAAVGQYVNGVSPLGALRAQGEAATTLARLQPGFQALAGRQALVSALANQADTRAKIAAQVPSMIQDQLNTFTKNAQARQQLALEAQAAGVKQQNTQFSQKVTLAKLQAQQDKYLRDYNLQVQKFNQSRTEAQAKAALPNTSLSKLKGYLVDSSGKAIPGSDGKKQLLPGVKVNAKGQIVTPISAKANKPFADLTKTQVATLRATANEVRFGVKVPKKDPKTGKNMIDPNTGETVTVFKPPLPYGKAISFLVSNGFSRRDAVAMLNNFYPPRMRGGKAQVKGYYGGTLPDVNPATNPKAAGPIRP